MNFIDNLDLHVNPEDDDLDVDQASGGKPTGVGTSESQRLPGGNHRMGEKPSNGTLTLFHCHI